MSAQETVFILLAVMTVGGAAMVALASRIMYAAFSLLLTFLGVAGLYALLAADFLAVAQVIIYVGGILVLILFGVMLTQRIYVADARSARIQPFLGGVAAMLVLGLLAAMIEDTPWLTATPAAPTPTTVPIGSAFMREYVFPFEFASIILLIALIGAALLARAADRGRRATGAEGTIGANGAADTAPEQPVEPVAAGEER